MTTKTYTQEEVDTIVNNVRIEERYIANQLMGNLGIPAQARVSPDGRPIYKEAADIVMNLMLAPPKQTQKPSDAPADDQQ